jgi:hypothetical protein
MSMHLHFLRPALLGCVHMSPLHLPLVLTVDGELFRTCQMVSSSLSRRASASRRPSREVVIR